MTFVNPVTPFSEFIINIRFIFWRFVKSDFTLCPRMPDSLLFGGVSAFVFPRGLHFHVAYFLGIRIS